MYTLAVRREFIARHFLIGGDWGPRTSPTPITTSLNCNSKAANSTSTAISWTLWMWKSISMMWFAITKSKCSMKNLNSQG